MQCPSSFSNIYSISGGSIYNPYLCYAFPNSGSDWDGTHNYCNSIGGTMLTSSTGYDGLCWNYLVRGWCVWTIYTWPCWMYWTTNSLNKCCQNGCSCYIVCQYGN